MATPPSFAADTEVRIYAAASLKNAVAALGRRYAASRNVETTEVYAASGTLARQIANGARADIFIPAHPRWLDWLAEQGVELGAREIIAGNRLAVIAPRSAPGASADALQHLAAISAGDERVAIGHPAYVPAGLYARQALKTLGHWQPLQPRLARAANARATVAMVARGGIALGLTYQTDARTSERVQNLGLLPAGTHGPIRYAAANGAPGSEAASAFQAWLTSPTAQAILADHGFERAP